MPRAGRQQKAGKMAGPLAQKDLFVQTVLNFGSDRPIAAYDELKHKAARELEDAIAVRPREKLPSVLRQLMIKHKIHWTKAHLEGK